MNSKNPAGVRGIAFVEFTSPQPESLVKLFTAFGFSRTHRRRCASWWQQGEINLILSEDGASVHSRAFAREHGPSIPAMGWWVDDPEAAFAHVTALGASPAVGSAHRWAIQGIGGSHIVFVPNELRKRRNDLAHHLGFEPDPAAFVQPSLGFEAIDHLTNNVPAGTMQQWKSFYERLFGFEQVRYFDIRGVKTGLVSHALRSPCGTFSIPINEGTEEKSQINEYLREYRGAGIQHLAFTTSDIVNSVRALQGRDVKTLDIDDAYYAEVFDRVPGVREDHKALREANILVDGDEEGYLLQIFTHNVVGPIFIEIIQRHNHHSFGEGNFGALFRSLERDQEKRGVL